MRVEVDSITSCVLFEFAPSSITVFTMAADVPSYPCTVQTALCGNAVLHEIFTISLADNPLLPRVIVKAP